mgnify:CR=1 FL=1
MMAIPHAHFQIRIEIVAQTLPSIKYQLGPRIWFMHPTPVGALFGDAAPATRCNRSVGNAQQG